MVFFFLINLFIFGCVASRAFSSSGERGLLFVAALRLRIAVLQLLIAVLQLLIAVASLVAEHRLLACGFQ